MNPSDSPTPIYIPRPGMTLDIALLRKLGLSWGQREDGSYVMTHAGWAKAELHGAVTPLPL